MTSPFSTVHFFRNIFFFSLVLILFAFALPVAAQTNATTQDTLVTVSAGKKYLKSGFHRFWFGKHYRNIWAEPIQVPVFRNEANFKALKMGGSFQTQNLRLADAAGREYVLRSIDKDPAGALPVWLQKTFLVNIMRDQTSVIHPYGAFIVPTLANAAGIYHTNPQLVYISKNNNLGEYSTEFSDMLALLEERPEGNREDVASFGNSADIRSSASAFEDLYTNNCNQVDTRFYLRSRLFDMFLGDWSRREDQWRWATFKEGKKTIFKGIPRDRDHAFFMFNDGVLTRIGSWFKPTYQTFSEDFKNLEGLNKTARPTDDYLLAMLTEDDFVTQAEHLKKNLTDDVITKAVAVWPENIYKLSGETFIRKLKSRRDHLPEIAREYYKILNKEIELPGTDKAERFEIERLADETVKVRILYKKLSCSTDSVIAEKVFHPEVTKKITLYGLAGKDEFKITGTGKKNIKIRIYPGADEDKIEVNSSNKGRKAKTRIYTSGDGDELDFKTKASVKDNTNMKARNYDAAGWMLRHRLH